MIPAARIMIFGGVYEGFLIGSGNQVVGLEEILSIYSSAEEDDWRRALGDCFSWDSLGNLVGAKSEMF